MQSGNPSIYAQVLKFTTIFIEKEPTGHLQRLIGTNLLSLW